LPAKEDKIKTLESEMSKPGFWDSSQKAGQVIQEMKALKGVCGGWSSSYRKWQDMKELLELAGDSDESLLGGLGKEAGNLKKETEGLELKSILNGEYDKNNAILSVHAGAGGTESCDWAQMLFRMYSHWCENRNYQTEVIDYAAGEEAGVRSLTVIVKGEYAYGYLKAESGVHRLVRISPFDANKRRHTSFASVDIIPELDEEIKIDIEEKDLRIDVYRASGPGGQGVNTTDSAVRITHLPTNIVVQCQNERSQYKNKMTAMKVLRARLYEKMRKEQEEKLAKQHSQKQDIAWGSQIRSYVFHPYNMVKDHRTDVETGNTQAVMDGEIDRFIEAFLKQKKT
jgi:peptide chain release factor 2